MSSSSLEAKWATTHHVATKDPTHGDHSSAKAALSLTLQRRPSSFSGDDGKKLMKRASSSLLLGSGWNAGSGRRASRSGSSA